MHTFLLFPHIACATRSAKFWCIENLILALGSRLSFDGILHFSYTQHRNYADKCLGVTFWNTHLAVLGLLPENAIVKFAGCCCVARALSDFGLNTHTVSE
jgi:hypothetical protein